jgi:hypothetical protein
MIEKEGRVGRSGKSESPRHTSRVNVLADRRSNTGYCAACGNILRSPRDSHAPVTCEDCSERRAKGERIALLFAERRRYGERVHPEERFRELFASAHVLLQEQASEEMVLPLSRWRV